MNLELRGICIKDLTADEHAEALRQLIPDAEIDAEVVAREQRADEEALIDTAEAARRLGRSPEYVRDHAAELGGFKLTASPKAPWSFDPAALGRPSPPVAPEKPSPPSRRRRRPRPTGNLLEVRGECP